MKQIPLSKPSLNYSDLEAFQRVLDSGWVSAGKYSREFENEFSKVTGIQNCVAMNSGASALFVAMKLLHKKKGKIVVPSFTFPATINAVLNAGFEPVISDVDERTMNITASKIENVLDNNTIGVVIVHFAGHPCNMDIIFELTKKYNLSLIEDCAHALGTYYKGKHVGSWGAGCFSFFASKNITTGEGGMLTCIEKSLSDEARLLISHGIGPTKSNKDTLPSRTSLIIGHNMRLAGLLGAMGVSQISRLKDFNEKRKLLASRYNKAFGKIENLKVPVSPRFGVHSWHMYVIRLATENLRNWLFIWLRDRGIEVSIHYRPPLHQQQIYKKYRVKFLDYTSSEKLEKTTLTLPLFPDLTFREQDYIIESIINGLIRWGKNV